MNDPLFDQIASRALEHDRPDCLATDEDTSDAGTALTVTEPDG